MLRRLHIILAASLLFGIVLQIFLQILTFQWATFFFVLLNLTVPFVLVHKWQKVKLRAVPIAWISGRVLGYCILIIAATYPAVQIIGRWTQGVFANPLDEGIVYNAPLFLTLVILAPIIEEVFFRGFLLSAYEEQSIQHSIVWGALWFALYHLNIHQGMYAFFLALILGAVMKRYSNIVVPILIHSGVNALSFLSASQLKSPLLDLYYAAFDPVGWPILFQFFYLIAFIYCLYLVLFKSISSEGNILKPFKMDKATWIVVLIFVWAVLNQ